MRAFRDESGDFNIEVTSISKVPTKVPEKDNKIYDYIDILSDFHKDPDFEYVKEIFEMESEDKNINGEYDDLSVFRIIALNKNTEKAFIFDYEYLRDEESIIQWKGQLSYEGSFEFIKKYGQHDFIIDAESLLEVDFIIGMQINLK